MKQLEFSVVVPLYNKEDFIVQTIQSVLDQTYPYFELLIIDDGSTDRSVGIVEQFDDERIELIHQENQGVSVARNRGIAEAKNDYIALLDADDEWNQTFVEEIKKAIKKKSDYVAYVTNCIRSDENNICREPKLKYVPEQQGEIKNYYKSILLGPPVITSSSVCLNKRILEKENLVNLFPVNVKRGEDLDAWTKINLNHCCFFINKRLAKINYDTDSASRKKYKIGESFNYRKWFLYTSDNWDKGIYLKLLTVYRILRVWAKILGYRRLKQFLKNFISTKAAGSS